MHAVKGCLELYNAIEHRPLGVTVDATKWRTYGSGIYNNCDKAVNHDVLLVGMTSTYYKIKNSWGITWGEQGYIRLSLGDTCGICEFKSYYIEWCKNWFYVMIFNMINTNINNFKMGKYCTLYENKNTIFLYCSQLDWRFCSWNLVKWSWGRDGWLLI